MSGMYDEAGKGESITTMRPAFNAGVMLIYTGDFHGMGYYELLMGRALKTDVTASCSPSSSSRPTVGSISHDARQVAVMNVQRWRERGMG